MIATAISVNEQNRSITLPATRPLRILNVNNHHADPGGYEVYFHGLTRLLRERGHHVVTHERDNAQIVTIAEKLDAMRRSIAAPAAAKAMREMIEDEHIDLVHVHNVWPLVSPSALVGAGQAYGGRGVPVVMKLADYKLTCPAGQHLRDGKICSKCVGGREHWRGNRLWSAANAVRNVSARLRDVFGRNVTLFLPNTRFVRDHFVACGFRREQMHVLPNFIDLPRKLPQARPSTGTFAAFVGRISPEKGVATLLEASRRSGVPVKIAGNPSPMPGITEGLPPTVKFVGKLTRDRIAPFLAEARMAVVPSEWWECFGLAAAEAQAVGLPTITTDIGGLPEVVRDGETGLVVPPGDPGSLATAMQKVWLEDDLADRLGGAAAEHARNQFSHDVFYGRLLEAYALATKLHRETMA